MLQILAVVFTIIGIVGFLFYASSALVAGISVLLSMLAIAGILYALGEIASDIRDINNTLRIVYAEKLVQGEEKTEDDFSFTAQDSIVQCPQCDAVHDKDFKICPRCGHTYTD